MCRYITYPLRSVCYPQCRPAKNRLTWNSTLVKFRHKKLLFNPSLGWRLCVGPSTQPLTAKSTPLGTFLLCIRHCGWEVAPIISYWCGWVYIGASLKAYCAGWVETPVARCSLQNQQLLAVREWIKVWPGLAPKYVALLIIVQTGPSSRHFSSHI